jgi:hypothetical protein
MQKRWNYFVLFGAGILGLSVLVPVGQAAEHERQGSVPKHGPRSVWRLVQQPTSLGIGDCAQSIIDTRAAGLRPAYVPYHGWKERHFGKIGPAPFASSNEVGPFMGGSYEQFPSMEGEMSPAQACPSCVPGSALTPSAGSVTTGPITSNSKSGTASAIRRVSYQVPEGSGESDEATGSPRPTYASNQGFTSSIGGSPDYSTTDSNYGGSVGVVTGLPIGVGSSLAPSGTFVRPGTAQLIVDAPPEMKLTLYRDFKMTDSLSRTIQSTGSRRIIECNGLYGEGEFGYVLKGELYGKKLEVEQFLESDTIQTQPTAFSVRSIKKDTNCREKHVEVNIGVRAGNRLHLAFTAVDEVDPSQTNQSACDVRSVATTALLQAAVAKAPVANAKSDFNFTLGKFSGRTDKDTFYTAYCSFVAKSTDLKDPQNLKAALTLFKTDSDQLSKQSPLSLTITATNNNDDQSTPDAYQLVTNVTTVVGGKTYTVVDKLELAKKITFSMPDSADALMTYNYNFKSAGSTDSITNLLNAALVTALKPVQGNADHDAFLTAFSSGTVNKFSMQLTLVPITGNAQPLSLVTNVLVLSIEQ